MFTRCASIGNRRMIANRNGRESCRRTGTAVVTGTKDNNPDLLAPLLADKFVNTSGEGKVTGKPETLADAKKTKWDSAEYDHLKVTVFGDTAIATGLFRGKGTESGKPLDDHERWTDTWVKMPNGQWQCVASQGTPIKKG